MKAKKAEEKAIRCFEALEEVEKHAEILYKQIQNTNPDLLPYLFE
jgi:hypothetical protein